MSNKKVYLLHLLMLGGCNHIMHQYSMYNSNQRNTSSTADKKHAIVKLYDKISKKHSLNQESPTTNYEIKIKEEITPNLINLGTHTNTKSKGDQEKAIQYFRKSMIYILTDDLIDFHKCFEVFYNFHEVMKIVLNENITDSLIACFLSHIHANTNHRPNKAKMFADAIARTAVNGAESILRNFSRSN